MPYAGFQPGYSAQAHFKPRAIIRDLFGDNQLAMGPAIRPEKD